MGNTMLTALLSYATTRKEKKKTHHLIVILVFFLVTLVLLSYISSVSDCYYVFSSISPSSPGFF